MATSHIHIHPSNDDRARFLPLDYHSRIYLTGMVTIDTHDVYDWLLSLQQQVNEAVAHEKERRALQEVSS